MSSTSAEQAIVSAKANVMIYDDSSKKWNPSGSSPGLSKVYIYQNLMNQTYRVVGRKVQDHECVINCMLSKSIKYQANQTFLQWRDTKQVYGLHFQSKDETDTFAQILKTAVDNLTRIAASNGNSNGDNISLGKRSISSEYNNPLITDEYERQNYNLNGHHQNGNNIYTGINTQRSQAQLNQVTSPPLSNSSSSSSSTISSNGLIINTMNGQNSHLQNGHHQNGHHQNGHHPNGNHTNGMNGYHNNNQRQTPEANLNYQNNNQNNQMYNLQQQQNQQINISSTSSSSSSSNSSNTQQPLYQSSPIPPPPPPPAAGLFGNNQNGFSNNNNNNNNHSNDNFSQKIYDVIPDNANYTPNNNQSNNSSNNKINNSAPPPPPLPTGLFNSIPANGAPPPPPPPMASMQALNINSNNSKPSPPPTNSNDIASELARSIANRGQLKKVDDPSNNRQTAPPQLDFLTEIRQKLEAKNRGDTNGSSNENENLKPSNGLKKINRNAINSDSPKPIKKISSQSNVITNGLSNTNGHLNGTSNGHLTNGHANGHLDNQSYDKLKQELMSEFRKELQMIKQDIVNSILSELRR